MLHKYDPLITSQSPFRRGLYSDEGDPRLIIVQNESQSPFRWGLYSDLEDPNHLSVLLCHNPLFVGASIRTQGAKCQV